jgi:uncharacterized membrane protein (DUF485 family)
VIEELLKVGGIRFLVPCVLAVLLVALAKGLFGVHQSRRTSRKDFLDLWSRRDAHDELWQQTAIRHLFGEWLPVPVIRLLLKSSQSGCALLEISRAWDLLKMDDETQAVSWKARRHRNPSLRWLEIWLFAVLYWIFGLLMAFCFFYAFAPSLGDSSVNIRWVMAIELAIFAIACLSRNENLKAAHKAVPRWLGVP